MRRTSYVPKLLTAIGLAAVLAGTSARAADAALPASVIGLDGDHDGSLDLAEAKRGAEARFAQLDLDHDGKLDKNEAAAARVHRKSFETSDSDGDKALDKTEYLKLVERRFAEADLDHDGKVTGAEFKKKHGKALRRLIE